jgi:TonB-dependent SusC/RagA subfamily outer membrane receptor
MKSSRTIFGLTVSLFVLLLVTPTLAQAQKKGSSRGVITAEELAKYPNDPIERIIARLIPGIEIVRTQGGGNMLRLRGAQTMPDGETGIQEDKPMLYVIDDMPIRTSDGSVPSIETQDVESIKVLKGPDAALYGIEGGDGVVLIFTKRGKRTN